MKFDRDYREWLINNNIEVYRGCAKSSIAPTKLVLACLLLAALFLISSCDDEAWAYSNDEIISAIWLAEGGERSVKPFGVLSVSCNSYEECRQICWNTVHNNRMRYAKWGHLKYKTYLAFLASRYAPIGASNDPTNLNKNWLKNVSSILERGKK